MRTLDTLAATDVHQSRAQEPGAAVVVCLWRAVQNQVTGRQPIWFCFNGGVAVESCLEAFIRKTASLEVPDSSSTVFIGSMAGVSFLLY